MSTRLKAIFKKADLQAAANVILKNEAGTDEARLALLNDIIEGKVTPSFEISEAIIAWETAQKKAAKSSVPKSSTPTGTCVPKGDIPPSIRY